jgi:hypothetical protein
VALSGYNVVIRDSVYHGINTQNIMISINTRSQPCEYIQKNSLVYERNVNYQDPIDGGLPTI